MSQSKLRGLIGLILALSLGWIYWKSKSEHATVVHSPPKPTVSSQIRGPRLPGELILANYGEPTTPPQEDLTMMSHLLENFRLVAKGDDALPLGSNAEMAAALRGEGRVKVAVLPANHVAFNPQGRLIDRWGTPLFFHVESARQIAVRSAGPDREMWTSDDLHRNPDGHFRTPSELNPPSL